MGLTSLFEHVRVMVRGGGDLGSGTVYRLHRSGFPVLVTELPEPVCVRRAVAFGAAVWEGEVVIEGITARLAASMDEVCQAWQAGEVPVVVDAADSWREQFVPDVIIDARMAKANLGTTIRDAPLVIGLGPGFEAGVDCHAVIETNRGHYLGRVIWQGQAEPDTGMPGAVNNISAQRVLRAPAAGHVEPHKAIGEQVRQGEVIAAVNDQLVTASFDGVLRGLVHSGVEVTAGMKIGDLDPRAHRDHCFTISEKSLAIGGGVLESVLASGVVIQRKE